MYAPSTGLNGLRVSKLSEWVYQNRGPVCGFLVLCRIFFFHHIVSDNKHAFHCDTPAKRTYSCILELHSELNVRFRASKIS